MKKNNDMEEEEVESSNSDDLIRLTALKVSEKDILNLPKLYCSYAQYFS